MLRKLNAQEDTHLTIQISIFGKSPFEKHRHVKLLFLFQPLQLVDAPLFYTNNSCD